MVASIWSLPIMLLGIERWGGLSVLRVVTGPRVQRCELTERLSQAANLVYSADANSTIAWAVFVPNSEGDKTRGTCRVRWLAGSVLVMSSFQVGWEGAACRFLSHDGCLRFSRLSVMANCGYTGKPIGFLTMSHDPLIRDKALQTRRNIGCVMVLCGYNYPFLWRLLASMKTTAGMAGTRP